MPFYEAAKHVYVVEVKLYDVTAEKHADVQVKLYDSEMVFGGEMAFFVETVFDLEVVMLCDVEVTPYDAGMAKHDEAGVDNRFLLRLFC